MKLKVILTLTAGAIALSACGGAATNTANTAVNKTTNAANTNAANTNATTNSAATGNTNSGSETAGDVLKIEEAGIMMTVPKGFKFSKEGEDSVVKTEDDGVDIRFTVPADGDYEAVIKDAAEELDSYLNDIKIENPGSKTTVSGMEATEMSGTAKDEAGEEVMWSLTIINAPKKPVLANIYAEKGSLEKNLPQVKTFLESVKKM